MTGSAWEHPASEALRARSPQLLRQLLVRDLRDAEEEWLKDDRDLMVALAPYHDCARRLGLNAAEEFRAAAAAGPSSLREIVETFGERRDVTLAGFLYSLTETPEGPSYRPNPPMSTAEALELED